MLVQEGNLAKAALVIYKEKAALQQRNNILKIADPQGWDTVNEYLDDPTGSSTEDVAELRYVMCLKERKRAFRQAQGRFCTVTFLVALNSRIAPPTNSEVEFKVGPTIF